MKTDALAGRVKSLAHAAFSALRRRHPRETFYFFGLFTTESGGYLLPTALGENALASPDLRFSCADSPYHLEGAEPFQALPSGRTLVAAGFTALRQLDAEGFFGRGRARERIVVSVVHGDMSNQQWQRHAERLNPAGALTQLRMHFPLQLPSGKVECWGERAESVGSLSISTDRRTLAFAYERKRQHNLAVYRLGRKPRLIFQARLPASGVALTADGQALYRCEDGMISHLDLASGDERPVGRVKAGLGPIALTLSPGGEHLVAHAWDSPVRVLDARTGKQVLAHRTRAGRPLTLSFSPNGRYLAVPGTRLTVLDLKRGKPRVAESLTKSATVTAWAPDGKSLFTAALGGELLRLSWPQLKPISRVELGSGTINALAVSPRGKRIAVCMDNRVLVASPDGTEVVAGQGAQESLGACAFETDSRVHAVGSDVDEGPSILTLRKV